MQATLHLPKILLWAVKSDRTASSSEGHPSLLYNANTTGVLDQGLMRKHDYSAHCPHSASEEASYSLSGWTACWQNFGRESSTDEPRSPVTCAVALGKSIVGRLRRAGAKKGHLLPAPQRSDPTFSSEPSQGGSPQACSKLSETRPPPTARRSPLASSCLATCLWPSRRCESYRRWPIQHS